MKKLLISLSIFFALFFASFTFIQAQANNCNNTQSLNLLGLNRCLDDLEKALNLSKAATAPLESQLINYQKQLTNIKNRVSSIEANLSDKRIKIDKGYEELTKQEEMLNEKIVNHYINSYRNCLFCFLLDSSIVDFINNLAYQQAIIDKDKNELIKFALMLSDLEEQEETLQSEQAQLAALKIDLDKKTTELNKIVGGAKAYQSTLSGQIANLSSLQQAILTGKSSFTFSIGDSNLSDDYYASIKGFQEAAPSGSFAIFSFGAYTHRKGMSQYGARGRAISGQGAEQILAAYYSGMNLKKDYDTGAQVNVQGHGTFNIEDYVKRIYEVPSSWTENNLAVLKAQAVAARTYALDSMRRNGSICTTEACQVFKPEPKGGNWEQAVNETAGWVLMQGDVPGFTQYASTHGVYITTKGWDTTDGSGGSNFVDKSYEKVGGSPWVYKAWYRKGYTNTGDSCGRSNPWLSPEEMADLINAAIVPLDGRITPITTSCWGGNPYSMQELRDKGGVTSVSGVSVIQSDGTTTEVVFQTNKGEVRLSGKQFRNAVYLRAPGYVRIPQGEYPDGWSFFNIERK